MDRMPPPSTRLPETPPAARSLRGLGYLAAWLLATLAAVGLSWWGVRTVVAGTAYDLPRTLPPGRGTASALPSTVHPSPSPSHPAPGPPAEIPTVTPRATVSSPPPTGHEGVQRYETAGGRAVFDLRATSADLVSATPAAGWSVRVHMEPTSIRVEFTSGKRSVTVHCDWPGGAPTVDVTSG